MAAISRTYLMSIISFHLWGMRSGYWKSFHRDLNERLNLECFMSYLLSVGQIYLITINRLFTVFEIQAKIFSFASRMLYKNLSHDVHWQILPLLKRHKVVRLNRTDARLANNDLPFEIQKLRCRVNFHSLRFTARIDEMGRKVVRILRQNGPFLVLHLRYEMDMLSFSGCTRGCSNEEVDELTRMR